MKIFKQCQNENCSAHITHKKFPDGHMYCPICGNELKFSPLKRHEKITDEQAKEQLFLREKEAEEIINDAEKFERLLQRLSKKMKNVSVAGDILSDIPILISLVKAYISKEYTDIPIGSIVAVTSALIYIVSPVDLIPDVIPIIGYVDDAAVLSFAVKMINDDLDEYKIWMKAHDKIILD